jgi:hypothetical protein
MADLDKEQQERTAGASDEAKILDVGGGAHQSDFGEGQRIPGPVGAPADQGDRHPPQSATSDSYKLLDAGGRRDPYHSPDGLGAGEWISNERGRSPDPLGISDDFELQVAGGAQRHDHEQATVGKMQHAYGGIADLIYYKLQADGLPMDWGDVIPTGTRPRISTVEAGADDSLPGSVVRVTFNQVMRWHPYLGGVLTPSNYIIREGTLSAPGRRLSVLAVRKVSDQVVDIYTEEFTTPLASQYNITIKNVQGADGDVIDPSYDDANFTGSGTTYPSGDEMHSFYGLYAGFQSDNATGVDPDTSAPTLQNRNPGPGSSGIAIDSNVYLELVDENGIDPGSVVIQINGVTAWQNQAQQNGFTVAKAPVVGPPAGWSYDIDPPSDFSEGLSQSVRVYARDVAPLPNTLDTTYTFTTGFVDTVGPHLANRSPSPGGVMPVDQNILFDIIDDKTGVDPDSVKIWVAGTLAYENQAAKVGFTVNRTTLTGLPFPQKGYRFSVDPDDDFVPSITVEMRVQCQDFGGPPNIMDQTYTFDTTPDTRAPWLTNRDPEPESIDVEQTRGIRFSIADDFRVELNTVEIWINDVLAFYQSAWKNNFTGLYETNTKVNGYNFLVVAPEHWEDEQRVKVNVRAQDTVPNQMDETYYFGGPRGTEQPFSTYQMVMRSIREHDQRSPGLLQFLCEEGFDDVWQRTMFDPASKLTTLFEPYEIDARWLPWLKSLVGLTRDLHFRATEEELRRVISLAVEMWNDKPAEPAIGDAVRMTTGHRFNIRNFFDVRMEGDIARITEELKNFDPNVLLFSWDNFISGTQLRTCDASPFWPCTAQFYIYDSIPRFTDPKQYTHLLVYDHPTAALNGLYPIEVLDTSDYGRQGLVKGAFPVQTASTGPWKLLNPNSDVTTEIRVVDKGVALLPFRKETSGFAHGLGGEIMQGQISGATAWAMGVTYDGPDYGKYLIWRLQGRFEPHEPIVGSISGAAVCNGYVEKATWGGEEFRPINRDLLEFLMNQVRASSERIDVVYVDFIEQFLAVNDLDQWTAPTSHGITVPSPGGAAEITPGDWLVVKTVIAPWSWTDQVATWRVAGPTTSIAYLLFWHAGYNHGYRVAVDFTAQTVTLQKNNSGTVSDLSSAVFLPDAIVPGIETTIRVDALKEGSGARLRVRVEGDYVIDYYEPSPLNTQGQIGMLASGATIAVSYVEVNVLPTEIQRIGPTP